MTDATPRATLDEVKAFGVALSPWAHLATVGADGEPDVVPVHPCWEGDVLWTMTGGASTKVRNVLANPAVALHWQVTAAGDGLEVWGRATFHDDLDTKRRLWEGVFDYDLNLFAPGGPEGSPDTGFLAIVPTRALIIRAYGMGGMSTWRA
jgi:general stress protein 26